MGQIDLDGSNSTLKADVIRGQASTTVKLGGLLDTDGNYIQTEKGGDLTSASPLVVDTDGDYFDVTGTTNFAAMTVAADRQFTLQFDGALTMTHHATNLDLPGEANITTAAGDVAVFQSTGANTVQCISYTKADGTAVVGGTFSSAGRLYLSSAQNNLTDGADVKVLLDGETFDTGGEGDPITNNKVTITDAGTYVITASVGFQNEVVDRVYACRIRINGTEMLRVQSTTSAVSDFAVTASVVAEVGAGEDIELYCTAFAGVSTVDLLNGATRTFLSWARVA